jgi:CheY-like chemotaxis protein
MAQILVVEDNMQNLKLTTIILQSAGHTVVGAGEASEAERAIAASVPDMIIVDVALPGRDGYTFTRELRQRPDTSRLPILALSAFAMPGDAEKALKAGCTDYLTKPVRRAPLLERVERLLGAAGTRPVGSGARTDAPDAAANVSGASETDDRPGPAALDRPSHDPSADAVDVTSRESPTEPQ